MKTFTTRMLLALTSLATITSLKALDDYPKAYWPASLQLETLDANPQGITFDLSFVHGSAKGAHDPFGDAAALCTPHIPINFKTIAPTPTDYTNETETFFTTINGYADDVTLVVDGKAEFRQLALQTRIKIDSGLFGCIRIPIRFVKADEFTFKVAPGSTTTQANLDFVKNGIDAVLAEQGIESFDTPFRCDGLGDVAIGAGWHGTTLLDNYFLRRLSGIITGQFLLPTSGLSQCQEEFLFSLPMGHNSHFGCHGQANAELELSDYFVLGGVAQTDVFFRQNRKMRLKKTRLQNGPLLLDIGDVKVHLGSYWNVGGYLKGGIPRFGLNVLLGYSCHSQEQTFYELTDKERANKIYSEQIINSDWNLYPWIQHTFHLGASIEPEVTANNPIYPRIEFSYHYPIYLKGCMETILHKMSMGASLHWDF